MNTILQNCLKNKHQFFDTSHEYYNHFRPQVDYLDGTCRPYVLKFENLTVEFESLMKKYKLDIALTKHYNVSRRFYTLRDFDYTTIELIKEVYKNDFETFQYSTCIEDVDTTQYMSTTPDMGSSVENTSTIISEM